MNLSDLQALHPVTPFIALALAEAGATPCAPHRLSLTLDATPDEALLAKALQTMVERHAELRVSYLPDGGGQPLLLVHKAIAAVLRTDGATAAPTLDVTRAPLFDVSLGRDEEARSVLRVCTHPLLLDAASTVTFAREWQRLYAALRAGESLPATSLQTRGGPDRSGSRHGNHSGSGDPQGYWRGSRSGLGHGSARLARAVRRDSEDAGRTTVCVHECALSQHVADALAPGGALHDVGADAALAGAWATLLARLAGQTHACVGVEIDIGSAANDPDAALLGPRSTMLPCAVDVPPDRDAHDALRDLRARITEIGSEAAPLTTLARWREQTDDFFDTAILANPSPRPDSFPCGVIRADLEPADGATAPVTLALALALAARGDSSSALELRHHPDALTCARARRLLEQTGDVLLRMATQPSATLRDVCAGSADERQTIAGWRAGATVSPGGGTDGTDGTDAPIHELFHRCAARHPTLVALQCGERTMTYDELDRTSTRLARELRRSGVDTDVRVGLYLERSPEAIVCALATLKAGGAYVPIDPDYPMPRVQHMIDTCEPHILLTTTAFEPQLPIASGLVLCLDSDLADVMAGAADAAVGADAGADDAIDDDLIANSTSASAWAERLAYVIFTSGSHGRPKGVMVPHRGLAALAAAQCDAFGVGEGTRLLQFASPSFDAAVSEWITALTAGATLVMPPDRSWLSGTQLSALCRRERITVATLPPSILATLPDDALPDLVTLAVAGEHCPPDLAARWARGRRLINAYGPSETTVCATMAPPLALAPGMDRLPIGRPLPRTRVYVLDARGDEVSIGAVGELYVGGLGVARGYERDPARTADRFLPDPFAAEPGARMYRTGDRVRWDDDGQLEFLGRCDRQMKVHGFRIEPEEVEAALCAHAAVTGACVDVLDTDDHSGLVAWLALRRDADRPAVGALQSWLAGRLPHYMVPRAFVLLDTLPIGPNGKVDRRALPAPAEGRPDLGHDAAPPRSEAERLLATIWCEVLGLPQVGIHDNFFALGGDSIQSLQIVARANEAGLQLTTQQCFDHQTIAELAAVAGVAGAMASQAAPSGDVPLTPIQRWFLEQQPAAAVHHYNQSVLMELAAPIDPAVLAGAVAALVERHAALRLRFSRTDDGWTQRLAQVQSTPVFAAYDLSAIAAPAQRRAFRTIATRCQASLDIERGPLLRVAFVDFGGQQPARLFATIHHLAVDGFSWRILLRDLQTACRQSSNGEPVQLAGDWTSFPAWSSILREEAASLRWTAQADWWRELLTSTAADVPLDGPDVADVTDVADAADGRNTRASAADVTVMLPEEETAALLRDAPAAYGTQINDVLLTALAIALTRWTGRDRCLFELESHGREQVRDSVDLSRTVGWFTTFYPVALDIARAGAIGDTLQSVKEQLRRTPDRGFGYALLRYAGADTPGGRALRDLPSLRVLFNYLGQMDPVLPEGALFRPVSDDCGPAQSDAGARNYAIEVNALIAGGRLQAAWTYSRHLHHESTIRAVAESFLDALRSIAAGCRAQETRVYTPSDFPEAELSDRDLQEILAVLDAAAGDE